MAHHAVDMDDLSLHVLDIARNSLEAGATRVNVRVVEDTKADSMLLEVSDDGRGMDGAYAARASDPFVTTRKTRSVGLGLSLLRAATESCDGGFLVESSEGKGTKVSAWFTRSHIDRPPFGDMAATIGSLIANEAELSLTYVHEFDGRRFEIATDSLRALLQDVPPSHPYVVKWFIEYVRSGVDDLRGGDDSWLASRDLMN